MLFRNPFRPHPASGPLHCLCPSPGRPFPQELAGLLLHPSKSLLKLLLLYEALRTIPPNTQPYPQAFLIPEPHSIPLTMVGTT